MHRAGDDDGETDERPGVDDGGRDILILEDIVLQFSRGQEIKQLQGQDAESDSIEGPKGDLHGGRQVRQEFEVHGGTVSTV